MEELFQTFVKNAPENMLQAGISEFGSMEAFQRNYVEKARKLYNQPENREILLESYGNKEKVLESAKNPMGEEGVGQLQQETDRAMKHLIQCKRGGLAPDTIEAKLGVCEYGAGIGTDFVQVSTCLPLSPPLHRRMLTGSSRSHYVVNLSC